MEFGDAVDGLEVVCEVEELGLGGEDGCLLGD